MLALGDDNRTGISAVAEPVSVSVIVRSSTDRHGCDDAVLPYKIPTVIELVSAAAKSGLPSESKSLTASAAGAPQTAKLTGARNEPFPSPERTETAEEPLFAVARSSLPSPSKSEATMAAGRMPTG